MLLYWIDGEDYNQILVNATNNSSSQYYALNGSVVRVSVVKFIISKPRVLHSIITDDTDTVILPKGMFDYVESGVVSGCRFKRLVVPLEEKIHFRQKALYGNSDLQEYRSLSKFVIYDDNVFPDTILRRSY